MKYALRYTQAARDDVRRHFAYLLEFDVNTAERAVAAIEGGMKILEDFPFSCRKTSEESAFLRELIIPFGSSGYVVLFEIEDGSTVTVLAIRPQREEDYH